MRSIALALSASLTWGFADFFGPLKGRTLGALRVLVYVQLGGLVVIALIVAIRGKGPADLGALYAIPAATSGTLGLYAYYRGMAVGAMSIVAPIAGISAGIPVIFGIITGDRPSPWQWLGIAAALGGVFLASVEPGRGGRVRGRRRSRAARRHRVRRLLPSHARSRDCRLLVGVPDLPDDLHVDHSRGGRGPAPVTCGRADPGACCWR